MVRQDTLSILALVILATSAYAQSSADSSSPPRLDPQQIHSLREEIQQLSNDAPERKEKIARLKKHVDHSFDMEIRSLQARLEKMMRDRESMVERRLARLLNPSLPPIGTRTAGGIGAPPKPYDVVSSEKQDDGSTIVKVRLFRTETRVREVPYTVMVPQTRTRTVSDREETYTVMVPEMRTRTESYTVVIPTAEEPNTVKVPKGKEMDAYLREYVSKRR